MKKKSKDSKVDFRLLQISVAAFLVLISVIVVQTIFVNFKSIYLFFGKILYVLEPILYGLIMTFVMLPFYNNIQLVLNRYFIEDKKRKTDINTLKVKKRAIKFLATFLSVFLWLFIIFGILSLILPELYKSVYALINNLPIYMVKFEQIVQNFEFIENRDSLLNIVETIVNSSRDFLQNKIIPNIDNLLSNFYSGVITVIRFFFNIVIGLIVMIYMFNLKDKLALQSKKFVYAVFDKNIAENVIEECKYVYKVFVDFFMGKIIDSLIIFVITLIFMHIFNFPYALLVSLLIGITNIIPFFGPFIGGGISFILVVLINPIKGLYLLLFVIVIQQFDGNILGPRILGRKIGIESFYVLVSILIFGGLFCFVGMIIAVPLWVVLTRLLSRFIDNLLINKKMSTDYKAYKEK